MIKAIAFLGNTGKEYEKTRHNAGWLLSGELGFVKGGRWENKFDGNFMQVSFAGRSLYLLKPLVFMNESGKSVGPCLKFYKVKPEELLVIHDDLELDFGWVGFKFGGGLAGHNGLRSIVTATGTENFARFRIGIGRPNHGNISSFVLSRFTKDEEAALPLFLYKSAAIVEDILEEKTKEPEKGFRKVNLLE